MNCMFPILRKSLLVAILAVSSLIYAADGKNTPTVDLVKGEALFLNGDSVRGLPGCVVCHGVAGDSVVPQNPKLAGQHEMYISKQLTDFKGAERNNPIMTAFANMLSEGDIKNVAAYLDCLPSKQGVAKSKEAMELGRKIFLGGIADKFVPACAGCHSPNGAGIPAQFPRVAGQHQDYAMAQLINFRNGARGNSPQMAVIAKRMSDDEIRAVADFMAGLK